MKRGAFGHPSPVTEITVPGARRKQGGDSYRAVAVEMWRASWRCQEFAAGC